MNDKNKMIITILLCFLMIISLQNPSWITQKIYSKSQENKVSVKFMQENHDQGVNITITAVPVDETKQITAIELPDGERIVGDTATFMSKKNGDYNFKVFYRNKIIQESTISAEGIVKDNLKPLEGIDGAKILEGVDQSDTNASYVQPQEKSEVFSYKVEDIKDAIYLGNEELSDKEMLKQITKANAETFASSGTNYFLFDADTNTITGYSPDNAAPKDVVIPEQINGIEVHHIGASAFNGKKLTSIKFNTTKLKSIGSHAFYNNYTLGGDIVIPEGVLKIGQSAFSGGNLVTSITIPGSATIGISAFADNKNAVSITLSEGITDIPDYAFSNCRKLASIKIPDSVTSIGKNAFGNCTTLTNITIPDGVSSIGVDAFDGCDSLRSINIPTKNSGSISGAPWALKPDMNVIVYWKNTVTSDGWVFDAGSGYIDRYIGNEEDIVMPNEFEYEGVFIPVKGFRDKTFRDNSEMKSLLIADGVTSIPNFEFYQFKNLSKITIPNSVLSIGYDSFAYCESLTYITLPNSITNIGSGAFRFSGITSMNLPSSLKTISSRMFEYCTNLSSVMIPDGVTSIESKAFRSSSGLTSISIPNSVSSIADDAFEFCSLTRIDIPSKYGGDILGAPWGSTGTIVYWKDTLITSEWVFQPKENKLELYTGSEKNVIMPDEFIINGKTVSVNQFSSTVFSGNKRIESIQIIDSVRYVPSNAFYGCSSLKTVTLGSGIKSLPSTLFSNLGALESINIRQSRKTSPIRGNQPWGANSRVKIYYSEPITFQHSLAKVEGEYARLLTIKAIVDDVLTNASIQMITLPDGSNIHVGASSWETEIKLNANGIYTFKGVNNVGLEYTHEIEVNDIGVPILQSVDEMNVYWPSLSNLTKSDIIALAAASAETEIGDRLAVTISDQDLDAMKAMMNDKQEVFITLSTTSPAPWNKTVNKRIKVTLVKAKAEVSFEVNHADLGTVNKTEIRDFWIGDQLQEAAANATLNPAVKNAKFVGWYKVNDQSGALTYIGGNDELKQEIVRNARETYRAVFTKAIYESNNVNGPSYGVAVPSYLNVEDEKTTDASIQLIQLPNETNASGDFEADLKIEVSVATKYNGYLISEKNAADRMAYELYYGDTYDNAGFRLSEGDTIIKKDKTDETTFFRKTNNQITVDIPGKVYLKDKASIKGRFIDILTFGLTKIN